MTSRYWPMAVLLASWFGVRLYLSAYLPLFGDEAFYWLESQNLAMGYSDLPPLTAWLIAAGEGLLGHHYFGLRFFFLLMGGAIPVLVYLIAVRAALERRAALEAAGWSIVIPLASVTGLLALPDVPLVFFGLTSVLLLIAVIQDDGLARWIGLGLCLAMGLLTHYRFLPVLLAGGVYIVFTSNGRLLLRKPGLWLAFVLAILALVPTLYGNIVGGQGNFEFQIQERNPWAFQWLALTQIPVQVLIVTPVLFALLMLGGMRLLRGRNQIHLVIATFSLVPLLVYWGLGMWADQGRSNFHWPLLSYLPLALAIPLYWQKRIALKRLAFYPALLACTGLFLVLISLTQSATQFNLPYKQIGMENFSGWRQIATKTRQLLDDGHYQVLVADNFMLGAELMFELDASANHCPEELADDILCLPGSGQEPGIPVHVLDHPRNHKHGRARQLHDWGMNSDRPSEQQILYVFEDLASDNGTGDRLLQHECIAGTSMAALPEHFSVYQGKPFSFYTRKPSLMAECKNIPEFGGRTENQ